MLELSNNPSLKEINSYKKQLNWGDISNIYHLAANSVGEIDGILTHGFDSAYKQLLDKSNLNLQLLNGTRSAAGEVITATKPQISLLHNYTQQHYELHCYPIINGERILSTEINNPLCPFIKWIPETMQMLFRVNSLVPFIIYSLQSGDKADVALLHYTNARINSLINLLVEQFDVVDIKGYSIPEFCKELKNR